MVVSLFSIVLEASPFGCAEKNYRRSWRSNRGLMARALQERKYCCLYVSEERTGTLSIGHGFAINGGVGNIQASPASGRGLVKGSRASLGMSGILLLV